MSWQPPPPNQNQPPYNQNYYQPPQYPPPYPQNQNQPQPNYYPPSGPGGYLPPQYPVPQQNFPPYGQQPNYGAPGPIYPPQDPNKGQIYGYGGPESNFPPQNQNYPQQFAQFPAGQPYPQGPGYGQGQNFLPPQGPGYGQGQNYQNYGPPVQEKGASPPQYGQNLPNYGQEKGPQQGQNFQNYGPSPPGQDKGGQFAPNSPGNQVKNQPIGGQYGGGNYPQGPQNFVNPEQFGQNSNAPHIEQNVRRPTGEQKPKIFENEGQKYPKLEEFKSPQIIEQKNNYPINYNINKNNSPSISKETELQRKADLLMKSNFEYDVNINANMNQIGQKFDLLQVKPKENKIFASTEIDESCALDVIDTKEYKEFLSFYQKSISSNTVFKDPYFPPEKSSLLDGNRTEKAEAWRDLTWKRPSEFFEGRKYNLFDNPNQLTKSSIGKTKVDVNSCIQENDIVQGILGDCYFLSSVSSLAEVPARISDLFITKCVNKAGIYCVKICYEGEWKAVYIDDYFPCRNYGGPVFTRNQPNVDEIWVLILEKAYAKLYGNYERIEAGLSREALRDLTGAPTKVLFNDAKDLWDEILKAEKQNYIMTAGSNEEEDLTQTKVNKGIFASHAYSLLGAYEVNNEKLVKLRNPWGNKEWKGKWCDTAPEWKYVSEQDKKRIGYVASIDDGVFFMPFEEFKSAYSDIQICIVNDKYKYSSIKTETPARKSAFFQLEVAVKGEYFLTILQKSKRSVIDDSYNHSHTRILIGQNNYNGSCFKNGKQLLHRENFVSATLEPGKYNIYCKGNWTSNQTRSFVLSAYGPEKVIFTQIAKDPTFIDRVLTDKALISPKKKDYSQYGKHDVEKSIEIIPEIGWGFFFFNNKGNSEFKVKLILKETKGLRFKKPLDPYSNSLDVKLHPGEKKIFVVKLSSAGYNLSYEEIISC